MTDRFPSDLDADELAASRAMWHEQRRKGIGASEAAAVLGRSPWSSPYEVWAQKTGRIDGVIRDPDAVERMRWGNLLEPVIIGEYAERSGKVVKAWPQDESVEHPEYSIMRCTPDSIQSDPDANVQVKTTHAYANWRGGIPLIYRIQVQHEMAVLEADLTIIVVLFGGQRLRWFEEPRNDAFIAQLEAYLPAWWERYVVADTPPPPDSHVATVRTLEQLHPDDSGESVILPADSLEWDRELLNIKAESKRLGARKDDLSNRIRASIGAATYGLLPGGKDMYSWATQERKNGKKSRVLNRRKAPAQ